ncbi:MAG TPA: TMEM175 family protein [Flavisolibacter sp.]|jgi:uncharacterized membrane protein|nr:TMEM175 family protein [Flavisolibacter sp.]
MKIGTTRTEAFSDGVIAIIITIMVLAFKLPDLTHQSTNTAIHHYVLQLLPYLIPYSFSFMMIGIFWINHHHMFHLLEQIDEPLLLQNLLFLFWMSLIPVSTAMISSNPLLDESVAIYGFILLMTTLSFAWMRVHTINKKLVHKDRDRELDQSIRRISLKARTKTFAGVIAYLCSVPLAFVSVYLSYVCFIIPPILFFIPDGIDNEKLAEKVIEKNLSR